VPMQLVQPVVAHFDQLHDPWSLPEAERLRPGSCPACGHLARAPEPGRPMGIVSHGTYTRTARGSDGAPGVRVRRFFCRGCRGTISILPDVLHPRRLYGAGTILGRLVGLLLQTGEPSSPATESPCRRTVRRWSRELLHSLWGWLAKGRGVKGPALSTQDSRRRLRRLFGLTGLDPLVPGTPTIVASRTLMGTVHAGALVWAEGCPWATPSDRTKTSAPSTEPVRIPGSKDLGAAEEVAQHRSGDRHRRRRTCIRPRGP